MTHARAHIKLVETEGLDRHVLRESAQVSYAAGEGELSARPCACTMRGAAPTAASM
eukprot:CAMPEP_0170192332 /NCGR_PEP_ID=MMETSP0040_2-20121228/53886_1 /TAXON_ID=641309 /ORGANISM="Lotharella oceanica, Strain CCMP622" /LENGTH=55 /DNA_ID=CAMNT_0010440657 /DNA_START=360 /DNA_END=527 /DNA_ORIENTATION=+